jgi:hypothetical protein
MHLSRKIQLVSLLAGIIHAIHDQTKVPQRPTCPIVGNVRRASGEIAHTRLTLLYHRIYDKGVSKMVSFATIRNAFEIRRLKVA